MDQITITREQLYQYILGWETAYRQGLTMSAEDAAQRPVEENAEANTAQMWNYFTQVPA